MDIAAYLRRIDYNGALDPSAGTLCALHQAHLLAVPFENLDIAFGRPIVLDEGMLFDKIVGRRRGGFCYELNGMFAALLRALGFQVTLLSAGVARADGSFGPEFDHLTLLVQLEERWLADVGFGDSFSAPLRLDDPSEQIQDGRAYQLVAEHGRWTLLERLPDAPWLAQYRFTLQPRRLDDFAGMCRYHQTSPDTSFTQRRMCSLARPDGRITLSDMRLITTVCGERQEQELGSQEEWAGLLRERFGIELAEATGKRGV